MPALQHGRIQVPKRIQKAFLYSTILQSNRGSIPLLETFKNCGDPLSPSNAHRRQAVA